MSYTDENIEMKCIECREFLAGLGNTIQHFLEFHPDYDALATARQMVEEAYEAYENQEIERIIDRAIDRDIEWQRHRI